MNYFCLKQGEGLANPAHIPLPKVPFFVTSPPPPPPPFPLGPIHKERKKDLEKKEIEEKGDCWVAVT